MNHNKAVKVYLSPEKYQKVLKLSKKYDLSLSAVVKIALEKYLEEVSS